MTKPSMKKIVMILTSHRLDCFKLCIDLLALGGSGQRFERVVILCSGVEGKHADYVASLPKRYPLIAWDFIYGQRGRGKPISDMQNECVRRYPDRLYFKLDEDTFVSADWDVEMERAYLDHADDPDLSLVTAVVTNNQRGAYHLMTAFPELGNAFVKKFDKPIVTERMGPVWLYPQCAEFLIRRFLSLENANRELREHGTSATETFSYPFSINCIAYDYRHWQEIGGVPEEDENGWGQWIPANNKKIVLATRALVHHYSFFVQQDWLDRTSLLEDIRLANLPSTDAPFCGRIDRIKRIAKQIPGAVQRRFKGRNKPA